MLEEKSSLLRMNAEIGIEAETTTTAAIDEMITTVETTEDTNQEIKATTTVERTTATVNALLSPTKSVAIHPPNHSTPVPVRRLVNSNAQGHACLNLSARP